MLTAKRFGNTVNAFEKGKRLVCWFSCGAASAVATKQAIEFNNSRLPVFVVYCDTGSEHEDNKRFMADCERWFGQPVTILSSDKYVDTWDVFDKRKYLAGVKGAICTTELKKVLRQRFEDYHDIQVFGFDGSENKRATTFSKNNPECLLSTPLIDTHTTKERCFKILQDAGISIPSMYKLGYKNNNCIGCVKGQSGYWNKIRVDFPEIFSRMALLERKLNAAINKKYVPVYDENGCRKKTASGKPMTKRQRIFLDELPPDMGNYNNEKSLSCGVLCGDR